MKVQDLILKAIESVSFDEMRRNKNLRKQTKKLMELTFRLKDESKTIKKGDNKYEVSNA